MRVSNTKIQKIINEAHEKFFKALKKEITNFSNIREFNFMDDFYCKDLLDAMASSKIDTFFYSSDFKSFGCLDTIVEACGHGLKNENNWITFTAQAFNLSLTWYNYDQVEVENLSDVIEHNPQVGVAYSGKVFGRTVNIIPLRRILRDEDSNARFEFWECLVDADKIIVEFSVDGRS